MGPRGVWVSVQGESVFHLGRGCRFIEMRDRLLCEAYKLTMHDAVPKILCPGALKIHFLSPGQ